MTTPQLLRVHLRSPMLIAGVSATADPADIDVRTDPHGLPEVPAGRITSRLRDCALGVAIADPGLTPALLELLGAAGGGRRVLTVGAARLPSTVRAVVAHTLATEQSPLTRRQLISAVTDAYTVTDFNTRIDRHGAPADGSLRSTRAVRPGLTFTAPLTWRVTGARPDLTAALAAVVLGMRQLGGRETDGRGHVDVDFGQGREQLLQLAGFADLVEATE